MAAPAAFFKKRSGIVLMDTVGRAEMTFDDFIRCLKPAIAYYVHRRVFIIE